MAKRQSYVNKKPPSSPEAEQALLGSIFFDPEEINSVADMLEPADFYVPQHIVIAETMWNMWSEGIPLDKMLVFDRILKTDKRHVLGGTPEEKAHELYIIADCVPESSHAVHYARIVKDRSTLRQIIMSCQEIAIEAYDTKETAEELIAKANMKFYDLGDSLTSTSAVVLKDAIKDVMVEIDNKEGQRLVTGLETGFVELDEILTGLQPGNLIILAARPSLGKTSFAMNVAERVALDHKKPVAFFSLETSIKRLVINLLCSHARVDAFALTKGFLPKEEYTKLAMAAGVLREAPIIFDDTMVVTPDQLAARARRLKARYGVELIIIDYLQLMRAKGNNRTEQISEISRRLKLLAKSLDVPVIALSQLSRAPMLRSESRFRPRLADLRESGAIEQDADVVLMLYREDYYRKSHWPKEEMDGLAEVFVAKQRNGPTGVRKLVFLEKSLRFESLAKQTKPGEDHY